MKFKDGKDIKKVLFTKGRIARGVNRAARWLDGKLGGAYAVGICTLKGGMTFYCDLIRKMKTPVQTEFIRASSYGSGTVSRGTAEICGDFGVLLKGRTVVLVEDIVDTGRTVCALKKYLTELGAERVIVVSLLNKPSRREVAACADYSVFDVDNLFLVGYGLDYAERYRDLPYIGVLKDEIYV